MAGDNWLDQLSGQLWGAVDALTGEARSGNLLSMLRPVAPFNRPALLAPVMTIGALLTFLMLSGIALASMGALLTALLALYVLLVQVFGVSVEIHPFGTAR
jgi:hypothetical protein